MQADGTCWAGGAFWQGKQAMRIAVSNWSTTEDDIDRSADAMLACYRATVSSLAPSSAALSAAAFLGAGPGVNSNITLLMVAMGRPVAGKVVDAVGRMTREFLSQHRHLLRRRRRGVQW